MPQGVGGTPGVLATPGVIHVFHRVIVKKLKCLGAYSTLWRYIVHVIKSNQGHAIIQ